MGNEDKFVKKYQEFLEPIYKIGIKTHIQTGFAFGFSNFCVFGTFTALFYIGGLIMKYNPDLST